MDLDDYIKKQNENLDSAVKVIEQYKNLQNNVNKAIDYIDNIIDNQVTKKDLEHIKNTLKSTKNK